MPVDIGLSEDGDLRDFNRLVSGRDLTAQRIRVRLRTHLGDWLLDASQGLPWATWMSTKPAPILEMEATVRLTIAGTPGVRQILEFSSSLDDRTMTVTATVDTDDGQLDVSTRAAPDDRNFWVMVRNSGAIA